MRKTIPFLTLALAATGHAATVTISNLVPSIAPGDRLLVYGTVDNTTGTGNAAGLLIYADAVSGLPNFEGLNIDSFYPGTYSSSYGFGGGNVLHPGQSYTGLLLAFEPYSPTVVETGVLSLRTVLYAPRGEGGVIFQQNDAARVNVVPEPASLSALGLATATLLRRRSRLR